MDNDDKKLEWMYKSKQDMINRDDYLTGKKVDKNFEENTLGNCVEYECLPASIGRHKADDKYNQVDILRKEMEDPLMLIKQKEMEARRKILENPLKLKKLNEILRKEDKEDPKKPSKKKKKKRTRSSSSSSSSGSDSEDLDKLLMEKYKKLQGKSQPADEESNFVDKKFKALTKELDKIVKKKKRKRSSSKESSPHERRDRREMKSEERKYTRNRRNDHYSESRYRGRSRSRDRYRSRSRDKKFRSRYRSREHHRRRNERSRSRGNSQSQEIKQKRRSKSPEHKKGNDKDKSRSPRKSPILSRENRSKQFGLVTATGEKLESSSKREVKLYTKEELKPKREPYKKYEKTARKQLTDEEKEKRIREMISNADWREKDREKNVKKYNDEVEKERKEFEKDFDREFVNKSMKHAQNQIGSLESRIKSNVNNIQRSGQSMNQNFAKR